jgi:hypothetical protein
MYLLESLYCYTSVADQKYPGQQGTNRPTFEAATGRPPDVIVRRASTSPLQRTTPPTAHPHQHKLHLHLRLQDKDITLFDMAIKPITGVCRTPIGPCRRPAANASRRCSGGASSLISLLPAVSHQHPHMFRLDPLAFCRTGYIFHRDARLTGSSPRTHRRIWLVVR